VKKALQNKFGHCFAPATLDEFFAREHYIACLLGKMYIDHFVAMFTRVGVTKMLD
jgi:hypothetical protein